MFNLNFELLLIALLIGILMGTGYILLESKTPRHRKLVPAIFSLFIMVYLVVWDTSTVLAVLTAGLTRGLAAVMTAYIWFFIYIFTFGPPGPLN